MFLKQLRRFLAGETNVAVKWCLCSPLSCLPEPAPDRTPVYAKEACNGYVETGHPSGLWSFPGCQIRLLARAAQLSSS